MGTRHVACLYVVLDCERPHTGGGRFDLTNTDEVTIGRGDDQVMQREDTGTARRLLLESPTPTLSAKHCRLLRVGDDWAIQDRGSRNGTWLNERRVDCAELSDGDLFQVGRRFFLFRRHALPSNRVHWPDISDCVQNEPSSSVASLNPELSLEYERLRAIADSKIPILLLGATGTGKELTAKAVHGLSARNGPFRPVNCGAIPAGLVESTLFGHVKGAFSGAIASQVGFIRAADKGTIFLDEIGELPLPAQATLLRVLQEGEVVPVGATNAISVDLRIVAATHQPLEDLVTEKRFRQDLFARVAGHVQRLRPLESRVEDFGSLFALLLRRAAGDAAKDITLTLETGWALLRYTWPMNVRQLEQAITRAVVLCDHGQLSIGHFPDLEGACRRASPYSEIREKTANSEMALRLQLEGLMLQHRGNVTAVARELGKGPTQIQRWLKRLGIVADKFRG